MLRQERRSQLDTLFRSSSKYPSHVFLFVTAGRKTPVILSRTSRQEQKSIFLRFAFSHTQSPPIIKFDQKSFAIVFDQTRETQVFIRGAQESSSSIFFCSSISFSFSVEKRRTMSREMHQTFSFPEWRNSFR